MNSDLLLPKKVLFPVALFGLILGMFTITFDFNAFGIPEEVGKILPYLALICNFTTVVVLLIDIFRNNLSTKYLWSLGFLLTGCLAGLYYLMNRDKYLNED